MDKLRIGLIGAGVFGGYHAQKIVASDAADFVGVSDFSADAREALIAKVGEGDGFAETGALIDASDAVIIATPATTHADFVEQCLRAGRHVLVEKPLALTGATAEKLAALAVQDNLVLQVGHQERFVFKAMGVLGAGEQPTYVEARREAPPSPTGRCEDVSVVFDLMIHDIDLAAALLGHDLSVLDVQGRSAQTNLLDEASATLSGPGGKAKLRASRCAQERKRTMLIDYPSGRVEIDFLARTVLNETPFDIKLDVSEELPDPLQAADEAFIAACLGRGASPIPGTVGARAAKLAEAIENAAAIPAT
ncbi:MAG: Gfo/Idh/MocA family oxidoreductase [Pseudomonadota bacterium]